MYVALMIILKFLLLLLTVAAVNAVADERRFEVLSPYVYENGELCSVENGCLQPTESTVTNGTDILGDYVSTETVYLTPTGAQFVTTERRYQEQGLTVYQQSFPTGLQGSSMGDVDGVSTGYPVFQLPNATEAPALRFVTPGDHMTGWTLYSQGYFWPENYKFRYGERAGIAAFILPGDVALWSVVMSALTQPMDVNNYLNVSQDGATLHWGVQGLAEFIPPGFSLDIIAATGTSTFVENVLHWGSSITKYHGTSKIEDSTSDTIGYWTDNGAYHYYNPAPFDNYDDLFVNLYNRTTSRNIPFNYMQIDSWWYYKGVEGGVKNWTAMPETFPRGIGPVHEETNWPVVAHNRYFASDTDYAIQNGGSFLFFIDEETGKALPLELDFWEALFNEAVQWGLTTYEQDWLDREFEGVSVLHTNLTVGTAWLNNMSTAAKNHGLAIQYCMALTRHTLHAAALNEVTQIRVSDDYHAAHRQWRIGHSSLFTHALGLRPFKDVFWTSVVNNYNPYSWCESFAPIDPGNPVNLLSSYNGHKNITASGEPCLKWDTVDYHAKYPYDSLYENYCRNPGQMKDRAFCFTSASLETSEDSWEWEYCNPPECDVDCFVQFGFNYIGNQSVTASGQTCVDWNGAYGLNGSFCRNPTLEQTSPWCFVTEDHSQWDYCNNQCEEAIEENPELQSAVATLSAGPVGIGDKEENINRALVMKSCRGDGVILKPDKPLTAIDMYFLSDSDLDIWTADVTLSGQYTFGIIFVAEVVESFVLYPYELNLENALSSDVILWQNYPIMSDSYELIPMGSPVSVGSCRGYLAFCLWYTSPVINLNDTRVAILGERQKWAPVSRGRILDVAADDSSVILQIAGSAGENTTLTFWTDADDVFTVECIFGEAGSLSLDVAARTCNAN